jgi:hypothetical protein
MIPLIIFASYVRFGPRIHLTDDEVRADPSTRSSAGDPPAIIRPGRLRTSSLDYGPTTAAVPKRFCAGLHVTPGMKASPLTLTGSVSR